MLSFFMTLHAFVTCVMVFPDYWYDFLAVSNIIAQSIRTFMILISLFCFLTHFVLNVVDFPHAGSRCHIFYPNNDLVWFGFVGSV